LEPFVAQLVTDGDEIGYLRRAALRRMRHVRSVDEHRVARLFPLGPFRLGLNAHRVVARRFGRTATLAAESAATESATVNMAWMVRARPSSVPTRVPATVNKSCSSGRSAT